jgi:hypothetical protein
MRLALALIGVLLTTAVHAAAQSTYATQAEAQRHCPTDTIVWLNIPTRIYHMQGERWYGRTKSGAYVCKQDADHAGDRKTQNGQ